MCPRMVANDSPGSPNFYGIAVGGPPATTAHSTAIPHPKTDSNTAHGWRHRIDRIMANGWYGLDRPRIVSGASFVTSLLIGRLFRQGEPRGTLHRVRRLTFLQCIIDQLVHVPFLVRSPHLDQQRIRTFIGSSFIHAAICHGRGAGRNSLGLGLDRFRTCLAARITLALSLLAMVLPGMMLREFMHSMLHNQLRQSEAVRLDFSVALTQIVSLLTLAWLDQLSIATCILVIGGSATLMALLRLPRLWSSLEITTSQWTHDLVQNWQIGKWTLGSYLIGSSAPTFLPWILAYFHGARIRACSPHA